MMSNLKLEVFESDKPVEPVLFYVYGVQANEMGTTVQQRMRSAVWKITKQLGIQTFTDDVKIYTLGKLDNLEFDKAFSLIYEGEEKLDVQSHPKIYASYAEYLIKKNLGTRVVPNNYRKYKITKTVTTPWIFELGSVLSSDDRQFRLRRKFDFTVKIASDCKVQLWLNIRSEFETDKTIYNLLQAGEIVEGLEVSNNWGGGENGVITSVGPETVVDNLPELKPLNQYMIENRHQDKIADCPDDSPVIRVRLHNKKKLYYYPQSLKPVVTLERIAHDDPAFSRKLEKFTKLDMKSRQKIAEEFLSDIGTLSALNGISFVPVYADAERIGFREQKVDCPAIICGNGRKLSYDKQAMVFANGFYKQPDKPVRFAYFYPAGKEQLMRSFSIAMTDFLQKGKLFGDSRFLRSGLMESELKATCAKEYELGDPLNYKKMVRSLPEDEKCDIAIVLVPTEEDETNPYSTFKTAWAEKNIPSQMISIKTAEMFERKDSNAVWFMQNIALGIFAKSGGIPWIVDDVPGDIDCFVGIDVATLEKGIHYPTCATVFDKNGRPVSFYKPKKAQKGEKINVEILQEIYDEVLLGYEEATGTTLKNIVIHRDGFSNEDAEWYANYFGRKGIDYSVIEVKKFVSSKMLRDVDGKVVNPVCGDTIINDDEAYIVTTDIKDGRASPRPLHIKRQVGDIPMETVVRQVLALSCMHFGATKKSRLPVTTYYADRICKNIDYVPEGQFGNRLFFL